MVKVLICCEARSSCWVFGKCAVLLLYMRWHGKNLIYEQWAPLFLLAHKKHKIQHPFTTKQCDESAQYQALKVFWTYVVSLVGFGPGHIFSPWCYWFGAGGDQNKPLSKCGHKLNSGVVRLWREHDPNYIWTSYKVMCWPIASSWTRDAHG